MDKKEAMQPDPKRLKRSIKCKVLSNAKDANAYDSAYSDPKCQRTVEYKKFNAMDTNGCNSAHPDPKCQNVAHEYEDQCPENIGCLANLIYLMIQQIQINLF